MRAGWRDGDVSAPPGPPPARRASRVGAAADPAPPPPPPELRATKRLQASRVSGGQGAHVDTGAGILRK